MGIGIEPGPFFKGHLGRLGSVFRGDTDWEYNADGLVFGQFNNVRDSCDDFQSVQKYP